MATSDKFYSYIRNIRKRRRELDNEQIRMDIERSFHTCMEPFPEPLRYDLIHHFFGTSITPDQDSLFEIAERLERVIDLFDMNYEAGDDVLNNTDWSAIKYAIDDNALDLDTQLMTYVMRHVVKRGLL